MTTSSKGDVQHSEDQMIEAFKQSMAPGASEFALSMAKLLYKQSVGKNVVFSPINIYSALALVLLGADGGTFDEIVALMGLPRGKKDEEITQVHKILGEVLEAVENTSDFIAYTEEGEKNLKSIINVTNGVFVQEKISLVQSYVTQVQSFYKSEISNVDFCNNSAKATETINEFISKSTQQRIPRLFEQPIDSATCIVLASCVYFKATWNNQFSKHSTSDENFYTGSENVLVKMMHFEKEVPYIDLPNLHLEAVCLDYKGNDVSMIVILPKPEKTLNDVVSSLRVDDLQLIADQSTSTNIDLKLPRMKFSWKSSINDYLVQLGLEKAFSNQCQLTNMVSGIPVNISRVTHAAEIEVDEDGTEASAATVIEIMLCCYIEPVTPKPFHVNRPFLFYIYHQKTRSILFFGTVHNPQEV
ncbi:leukocyte elastase inhibitor C-like [Planococcus citri]|uniref:leukocyte elastase inhibitor C-like n=1 Tax=Planococcus citri TaxID=170843 RepID=UPI0031F86583